MEFDLLIRGGVVFDGSGRPPHPTDVAVIGDRIAGVGQLELASAAQTVDARGMAVAPGFIDSHTHSDMACFLGADDIDVVAAAVRQGVTTEVCGNCGFSPFPTRPHRSHELQRHLGTLLGPAHIDWTDLAGYREAVQRRGLIGNLAPLVGHGSLRAAVLGFQERAADRHEIDEMTRLLDAALEQGAVGLSSGLVYMPGAAADTDEMIALARSVADRGRVYTSHIRGETDMVADSVREAIEVGRKAAVPVHISHHKVCGRENYGRTSETLEIIDAARRSGLDISTDMYPYTAASTLLYAMLPGWVQAGGVDAMVERLAEGQVRDRIQREFEDGSPTWQNIPRAAGWDGIVISNCPGRPEVEGTSVADLARDAGASPANFVFDLLVEQRGDVMMIVHMMDEGDVARVLSYAGTMIGSDGIPLPGKPHPRWAGTFARVLGLYSREQHLFGLSEAIHKMTAQTADRFGLQGRGRLIPGAFADIVVFEPDTIRDAATYDSPLRPPAGVKHVVVNGRPVVEDGILIPTRPGRLLSAS